MGFLSGIFGGANPTLDANIKKLGGEADFAQGIGQGDTTAASKWYNDILGGDPTKMAEAVSPEISAAKENEQQQKNQVSQFGGRSGGTSATIAGLDADTRAQIIRLLGGLQSGAAGSLASLGTTEQGLAFGGQQLQDEASQQQMENWKNSILGKAISGAVSTAESAGLGAAGL